MPTCLVLLSCLWSGLWSGVGTRLLTYINHHYVCRCSDSARKGDRRPDLGLVNKLDGLGRTTTHDDHDEVKVTLIKSKFVTRPNWIAVSDDGTQTRSTRIDRWK